MHEILGFTLRDLRRALKRRKLSAVELARFYLDRISQRDEQLGCFLTCDPPSVLEKAQELDRSLASGDLGSSPLAGIPVALKDNIVTKGLRTTAGSAILDGFIPPYDAAAVEALRRAGALILGKTNCDEFAMGSSTENSSFFPTRNPWDQDRVPGGSSGGSAAAVAARLAPAAFGSDTGGSIRQPAAFCGVVGVKPTYGRVSRYGLVAYASSLDQIGPLATRVADAALLLQAVSGPDDRDATCSRQPAPDFSTAIGREISGLRIGVPPEWLRAEGNDPQIVKAVEGALRRLESLGCRLVEVSLPRTRYAVAAYYIVAPAEASSNLARYDGIRFGPRSPGEGDLLSMYESTRSQGFGAEVKRRILIGTFVLSAGYIDAFYRKAAQVRRLLAEDYAQAFEEVDLLAGPTTPSPPFRIGEKTADPLQMYLSDVYTVGANLAGLPGLSMPCGFTPEGLPIGFQLQAPAFQEQRLFRVAHALEEDLGLSRLPPGAE